MNKIKIDKDVPVPVQGKARGVGETIRLLNVGESFFMSGVTRGGISGSMTYQAAKLGRKFVSRTVIEDGVRGVRVWRTA